MFLKRWLVIVGCLLLVAALGLLVPNDPRYARWLLLMTALSGWCFFAYAYLDIIVRRVRVGRDHSGFRRFVARCVTGVLVVVFGAAGLLLTWMTVRGVVTVLG